MDERRWDDFERRMRDLRSLRAAAALLSWDQETCLPRKASDARGRQAAALEAVIHERLCSPALADLIAELEAETLSAERAAQVRLLAREVRRANRLSAAWVRALAEAQSAGLLAWREARAQRSFAPFAPRLRALVALRREQAAALADGGEAYDALLAIYEPGARLAALRPLFGRIVPELRKLSDAIAETGKSRPNAFGGRFDLDKQWDLSLALVRAMGFDLEASRLDRSAHPFSTGLDPTDVRLTNRFREDDPRPAIFGALHECGHGLYEQGFGAAIAGTCAGEAASFGLHESQSRLWENLVGRSRPFWDAFFPELSSRFPDALAGWDATRFHAAVNEVRPSPIRVEADEVTYNLHIALRLEVEAELVGGDLDVADLPGAWSDATRRLLGFTPRNDAEGVLQDIHWAWGELGYFPTYTIGNLYAASILAAAERALPGLWEAVGRGELLPLREWLRAKIHAPGHLRDAEETVRAATGEGLTEAPFLDYLWQKYGALYGVGR